jgi:hypothetical protein
MKTDWEERLRAAGYTGEMDLGSLLRACPVSLKGHDHGLELSTVYGSNDPDKRWRAGYFLELGMSTDASGSTPEEAVASLWIKLKR